MANEMGFEEILSSVVNNEELMSKISKIVSSHKDDESSSLGEVIEEISTSLGKSNENDVASESSTEEKSNEATKTSESKLKIPTLSRKNHDLLCALKPFMSKRRQDMIDGILKLEQMSEIAKLVR